MASHACASAGGAGLALLNPMFSKIGGVEFYYPKSALYMDGI